MSSMKMPYIRSSIATPGLDGSTVTEYSGSTAGAATVGAAMPTEALISTTAASPRNLVRRSIGPPVHVNANIAPRT
jgi:hypothetical protein